MTTAANKHTSYFELLDALKHPGCPVCRLAEKTVTQFFDNLIYENVNDPGIRQSFRAAYGFCNTHAWQLVQAGGTSGIAILYREAVQDMLEAIDKANFDPAQGGGLRWLQQALGNGKASDATAELVQQLTPQVDCPACQLRNDRAGMMIDVLLEHLLEDELSGAFESSSGLCLPHFRTALRRVQDATSFQRLAETQLSILRHVKSELDELIRKYDYRFAQEPVGQEADAWMRAVALIASEEGYGCP